MQVQLPVSPPSSAFAFLKLTSCSLLLCLSGNESVIMWMTLMNLDLASVCLALFLGLIFMVLFEIFRINSCRGQTPPGPRPLPFVGTIPSFTKPLEAIRSVSLCCVSGRDLAFKSYLFWNSDALNLLWIFSEQLSQYGEMSTLYFGRKPMIILNTIQVTKEALVQEAFSGRPVLPLVDWLTNGLGQWNVI